MIYEVKPLKSTTQIDFGATGVKEVLQNVSFILSTMIYSCPLDRAFGWLPDLDSPIVASKATNASRIMEAIQINEPRAVVQEINFEGNGLEGILKPTVKVILNE
ncbi:hypothetical protein [Psychrobacillus sp. FSL K6-1267]|uniref:hypothetical protein n=1 Tax=Psychrobacillus sp. FSL K6-1267 TaxID=2921543 RepID=UPI0030FBF343